MSALLRPPLKKSLVVWLVICMTLLSFVPRDAVAMLIPPDSPAGPEQSRDRDLQQIRVMLESKVVGQRLQDLGLTAEEIQAKMSQFSDDQIHQVAQNLDDLGAGGFHALLIVIGVVVGAIILFLVLLGH